MRRTSYQRGFVAGEIRAVHFIAQRLQVAGNEEARAMVESLGPVAAVAGIVGKQLAGEDIAPDDYEEWAEEELRQERARLVEALDRAEYFGTYYHGGTGGDDEARAAQRAFERIPEHLQGGVRRYLDEHIRPGDFLMAVFEGDLFEAFGRADVGSRAGLWELVTYCYNYAPAQAWGSKREVELWLTPAIPEMTVQTWGPPLTLVEGNKTACPGCGEFHVVRQTIAPFGRVSVPEDGRMKAEHPVQFVYCRAHTHIVGVEGKEFEA